VNNLFSVADDNALELADLMNHLDVTYGQVTHANAEWIAVLEATDDQLELLWNASRLLDCEDADEVDETFSRSELVALWEVKEFLPEEAGELLESTKDSKP
jgi:hypothetical protein